MSCCSILLKSAVLFLNFQKRNELLHQLLVTLEIYSVPEERGADANVKLYISLELLMSVNIYAWFRNENSHILRRM
jgi:hypothetical protein